MEDDWSDDDEECQVDDDDCLRYNWTYYDDY
jgi:hypothetical protein